MSLSGGLASASFLLIQSVLGDGVGVLLLSAIGGALVAILLNTTLVAGVVGLERGRSLLSVWRELAWPTIGSLPFGFAALFVAVLYGQWGPVAAVFILAPLFVLRRARHGKVELEAARERTLRAFVSAVELKDPYTSRHSERVAAIALEIHRALGKREEFLQRRYYGALLHDIGKVGVSGRILGKPGRLTSSEYEVIQRHPGTGAFVVGGVSFLQDLVPEILHHHERIDGRGYPSALADEEIPFEARVLAVADTFEALTSDRPYRNALSHQQALVEIRASAGSQLDPVPVEALTRLIKSGHMFPALPKRVLEPSSTRRLAVAKEA
jgi:HD-GYP domain-containing protein (c-di-GMP phosphodiesterase class II)